MQEKWDVCLITAFFRFPIAPMNRVVYHFMGETGLTFEEIMKYKRTPKPWHLQESVTRFVSAHIPKLGELLWRMKHKDDERIACLAAKIQKTNWDTINTAWSGKEKQEHNERTRVGRAYKGSRASAQASNEWWGKHKRSSWNTCK